MGYMHNLQVCAALWHVTVSLTFPSQHLGCTFIRNAGWLRWLPVKQECSHLNIVLEAFQVCLLPPPHQPLSVLVNMAKNIFRRIPYCSFNVNSNISPVSASHCSRVSFWCLPHFSGGFQCGFNHPLHCCACFIFSFPFFVLNLGKVCLLEVSQEQNPAFSQPEEQNELWIGLLFCKRSITLVYLLGVCGFGACTLQGCKGCLYADWSRVGLCASDDHVHQKTRHRPIVWKGLRQAEVDCQMRSACTWEQGPRHSWDQFQSDEGNKAAL